jgi:hypothetical protein
VGVDGGAYLEVGRDLDVTANNLNLETTTKTNMISSGTIKIEAEGAESGDVLDGDEPNVSLILKGNKRVSIQSNSSIAFQAPLVDFSQSGQIRLSSADQMEFNTGAGMNLTANTIKQSSMGQFEQICGGPTDFIPLSGPARKVTITESPVTGGAGTPSDSYTNAFGGRSEIYIGPATNTKTIAVGTETKTIVAGSDSVVVGTTATITDPTGSKFLAPAGAITATAGTVVAITANVVSLRGNAAVTISGASITLGSPGSAVGPIVCGSDIHPILGIPYLLITGPKAQNLAITP